MSGLEVETLGRVVTATFDGTRHNTLDAARYRTLRDAVREVSADQVLMLRSRGRHFCVGQDLDEFDRACEVGTAAETVAHGAEAVTAVLRCAGPVVALVQGAAIGAGALLVAAADAAVLAETGWMSLPELRLGLPLGASIAELALPPPLVRRMLYTGERVDATALAALGAARLVTADDLERSGSLLASRILALDAAALRVARGLWDTERREAAAQAYEREVAECTRLLAVGVPPGHSRSVKSDTAP